MDNIGCWNFRGLNDPHKQSEVLSLLMHNKLGICGLLETKVKQKNIGKILLDMLPDWALASNISYSSKGRVDFYGCQTCFKLRSLLWVRNLFILMLRMI